MELEWQALNASVCDASGGWNGRRGLSGAETVGPLQASVEFVLSCQGDGGSVVRRVSVQVETASDAEVSLTARPAKIVVDGTTTLRWSAVNVDSCTASGGWSGPRELEGSEVAGPLSSSTSFRLSCSGPSGEALSSVTVEVLDKTIRWQPPRENVDGSPLTDLSGYVIYWGAESRSYTGSKAIRSPNARSWRADIAPGTYYFAMTAVDMEGNESAYSNEIIKTIP